LFHFAFIFRNFLAQPQGYSLQSRYNKQLFFLIIRGAIMPQTIPSRAFLARFLRKLRYLPFLPWWEIIGFLALIGLLTRA
jgi:hypothetical protein